MSFQCVKLPKDAEGREIPLNTKVLYKQNGEKFNVESFDYWPEYEKWYVSENDEGLHVN